MTSNIRVRYRFEDTEFEAEGPVDEVNRHALEYLSRAPRRRPTRIESEPVAPNLQLSFLAGNEDTPQLADGGVSYDNGTMSTVSIPAPIDICTLFTTCAPKTQADQVLMIVYHCEVYQNLQVVGYQDIDEGFKQLARCGVPTPTNPRQAIKQLVEKDKMLCRPNRETGEFALTVQGRAFMDRRLSSGPN
jgi:hypothetical protein